MQNQSNPWEEKARLEKANLIAAYLFRYIQRGDITLRHVEYLEQDSIWQKVAAEAGANAAKPPSEATRQMVLEILKSYLPRRLSEVAFVAQDGEILRKGELTNA